MAEEDLNNFMETRRLYLENIAVNLCEAQSLMVQLNRNFQVWTERTGQLDHLAEVWAAFQNKLASLSSAFREVDEEKPNTESGSGPVAELGTPE